jgi:hypothetical protein
MSNITYLGRLFVAIAMVAFGVQHFIYLNFVTRLVPPMPAWIPGQPLLACLFGAFLVATAAAILSATEARTMALLLGGILLLSFLLLYLPPLFADPPLSGLWTRAGKALAFAGGSFLVASSFPLESASLKGWRSICRQSA